MYVCTYLYIYIYPDREMQIKPTQSLETFMFFLRFFFQVRSGSACIYCSMDTREFTPSVPRGWGGGGGKKGGGGGGLAIRISQAKKKYRAFTSPTQRCVRAGEAKWPLRFFVDCESFAVAVEYGMGWYGVV